MGRRKLAQREYRQRRNNNKKNHDVLGVVLICISAVLLLCIVIPPILGIFSRAIFGVTLGVFGFISYPILLSVLLWGVMLLRRKKIYVSARKVVSILLIAFFAVLILQLATSHAFLRQKFSDYIYSVYAARYTAGGVVFGVIAFGLKSAITEIGCYIVFSLLLLAAVAVMLNVVGKIKNRKASVEPAKTPKAVAANGFTSQTEAQRVMPVQPPVGLYIGTIERKSPPVQVETGKSSELKTQEKRLVKDYTDENESATAARVMLFGDSEKIIQKSVEEFRSTSAPDANARGKNVYDATTDYTGGVQTAQASPAEPTPAPAAPIMPQKIVHDEDSKLSELYFPVQKNVEYNDSDDIINADDYSLRLQKEQQELKRRELEGIGASVTEKPYVAPIVAPTFDTRRIEPERIEINTSPIIVADAVSASVVSSDVSETAIKNEERVSPEDRFLNTVESMRSEQSRGAIENSGDGQNDIINADAQSFGYGGTVSHDSEPDITPGDIIVADAPPPKEEVTVNAVSKDVSGGALAFEPRNPIVISQEPSVDLSETHDIIDGEDKTGMYIPLKEDDSPKPAKRPKNVVDNQISMEAYMKTQSENAVVVSSARHRKRYSDYVAPPLDFLKTYEQNSASQEVLDEMARSLESTIELFLKSPVKVVNIVPGPTVTRFELEVSEGTAIKQITSHQSDIEYALAAASHVRIEAPIPGKRAVGIEVPNRVISTVGLKEIIQSEAFDKSKSNITMAIGKGISGDVVLCDLESIPHLLIAGTTGSGKSACLNGLIISLLYKSSPDDLRFILVDPKRVEFSAYSGMPHLLVKQIIYEQKEVLNALKWARNEMERRYLLFSKYSCVNLGAFNKSTYVKTGQEDKLPHIVIIIDELADVLESSIRNEIEEKIRQIAAKARAAGIHLILATQRPSADVITGTIKTNLSSRIAFKVTSQTDSRVILDMNGAEELVGRGDMIFAPVNETNPRRVQGSFIDTEEVLAVIDHIKKHYECDFDDDAEKAIFASGEGGIGGMPEQSSDELLPQVCAMVLRMHQASTSGIQRRFSIGYNRAGRIIDQMEALGFIGPSQGVNKAREVYITVEQFREHFGCEPDDLDR